MKEQRKQAARYTMYCAVDPDQDVMAIRFAARAGVLPITRIVLNRPSGLTRISWRTSIM